MADKNKKLEEGKLNDMLTDKYSRSRWKHLVRIFGFFVLLALPVVLINADLQLAATHPPKLIKHMLIDFFLVIVDLTMLVPIIFEVDKAQAAPDKLILNTIFWKGVIPYSDIIAFQTPQVWQFAMLRTKRCFYLINKKDMPRFDELMKTIVSKLPPDALCHKK